MSQKLNSSILAQLECPVCMNYMTKPILSCTRGHSICNVCGHSVKCCPICKNQISLNFRNYTLEAISELLEYPCSYADTGCREYIKFNSLKDHRLVCSYRPYNCMLAINRETCQWKGTRFELYSHALAQHEKRVSVGENVIYTRNSKCLAHEVNLIKIGEEIFLLHCKVIKKTNESNIYWAMQYIGKPENKNNYNYTLKIIYDKNRNLNKKFVKRCCDDLKSIDEIIVDGTCISIPVKILRFYENKESKISYTVTINKI